MPTLPATRPTSEVGCAHPTATYRYRCARPTASDGPEPFTSGKTEEGQGCGENTDQSLAVILWPISSGYK